MHKKTLLDGQNLWEMFDSRLASYAQKNADSRGRRHQEVVDPDRLPFQRDRDRIIHANAFRRLRGKMQVVSPKLGDHFRNRLSHTLEVAQIARDIARSLRLNEDLTEAIALAHDLGHPPFGHSGEEALDLKMREHGGHFEHNEQSLRVVEVFESRYTDFSGLNLSYEVLEGIQKHETFFDRPGEEPIFTPHLEAQVVDISDAIAYLSADLEDGLRGGFFTVIDLQKITIPARALASLSKEDRENRSALIRRVIKNLMQEIVADTRENLNKKCVQSLQDVQKSKEKIVVFNERFAREFAEFKEFLWDRFYRAPEVKACQIQGREVIQGIFDYLMKREKEKLASLSERMSGTSGLKSPATAGGRNGHAPVSISRACSGVHTSDFLLAHPAEIPVNFLSGEILTRRICDYIAGMTDEFAVKFWEEKNAL